MGEAIRGLRSRRVAFAGVISACLILVAAHSEPARATDNGAVAFIGAAISPQTGYYGRCGEDMPVGVTVLADLASPLSLDVTVRYQYVSVDPHVAPSPVFAKHMPLQWSGTYMAAIDISDEAPGYL